MKYFLSILAIFKNEEMIIKEWIEHYLWQGVEHFYLIDNGSDDNYLTIIQPYIDNGLVTLYNIPERYQQSKHYNTVFNQIKKDIEWLIVCDIDEYFFGRVKSLKDIIIENNNIADYITCEWINFGSSGYIHQPSEIRTSFIKKSGNTRFDVKGGITKYIVRSAVVDKLNVHTFVPNKSYNKPIRMFYTLNHILLFHYQIMSKEYYEKVKMTRGAPNGEQYNNDRDWKYFKERDFDKFEDLRLSNLVKNGY